MPLCILVQGISQLYAICGYIHTHLPSSPLVCLFYCSKWTPPGLSQHPVVRWGLYVKRTPEWLSQDRSSHILRWGYLNCSYCKCAFIIYYMTPLRRQDLSIHVQFEKIYWFFSSKSFSSLISKACLLWTACEVLLYHLLIKSWTFKLPDLLSSILSLDHLVSVFHGSSTQRTM